MSAKEPEQNEHFGYELIRDHLISDILGKHETEILYWAGKSLARKFPLDNLEDAPEFFAQAHFGELKMEKATKDETIYLLKPSKTDGRCFKLEAGFLAQQKQEFAGCLTEAYDETLPKKQLVRIILKTDLKEKV